MKNFMHKFVFCLLVLTLSITSLFFCFGQKNLNLVFAIESEPDLSGTSSPSQTSVSIFIRKPNYSVYYGDKLFFIDEADNLLKSYNTTTHSFDSDFLDLSDLEILDASFLGGCLYILAQGETENSVVKIDLITLSRVSDFAVSVDKNYSSFFVQKTVFNDKEYTLITYSVCGSNPMVSLIDDSTNEPKTFELKFEENNDDHSEIKEGLKETISYQDANSSLHIIFVYYKKIAHFSISSIDELNALSADGSSSIIQSLTYTTIPNDLADLNQLIIMGVSFAKMNSSDYLAISFSNNLNEQHFRLYSFKFGGPTETITYVTTYHCKNAEYMLFNDEYYSYSDDTEQKLTFSKIFVDDSGDEPIYAEDKIEIDNPQYEITYYSEENFVYKESNKLTELYEDPWGANFNTKIGNNSDVVKIGEAKLVNNGYKISDYDYCLFTYNDTNRCGFIKNSDLDTKSSLTPKEAGFKEIDGVCIVTVWPKTSLYSLPTTIAGTVGKDGSTLNSQRISSINENAPVQILDVLCNYYANNTQMIKVRVNDSQDGYIDANCIRTPAEVRDFVITNATIKNDDTTVYLSPSLDSTVLSFKLDAGKNVRINGKRNTKTGFTSITFNDEYGNEYSGYIETDYIKSDAWSTLQIVGCVLIAINIGLLILILIYKKNHLGNRGQKIEKES